jgi:alpha-aminoadipate carrier protein LysW
MYEGMKMNLECTMCGGKVVAPDDALKGEIVSCGDCGLDYEIQEVSVGTAILKAAENVKEDWGE